MYKRDKVWVEQNPQTAVRIEGKRKFRVIGNCMKIDDFLNVLGNRPQFIRAVVYVEHKSGT